MEKFSLSPEAICMVAGSTKGTQPKYYSDGCWYKADQNGYEGLAEYLASIVLKYSNIDDFVSYSMCKIGDRNVSLSHSFLHDSEIYFSFERIFQANTGMSLESHVAAIPDVDGKISFVEKYFRENLHVDITDYLSKTLTLDALLLNSDRHFNNLGIVANLNTGEYRPAPIFDNGDSLLSSFVKYPPDLSIEENAEKVIGRPFSANLYAQAKAAGITLKLDYAGLSKELDKMPSSRALTVLNMQLEKYRAVIPNLTAEQVPAPTKKRRVSEIIAEAQAKAGGKNGEEKEYEEER